MDTWRRVDRFGQRELLSCRSAVSIPASTCRCQPPDVRRKHELTSQHSALDPTSPAAQHSQRTALEWFETQWKLTGGKGAPKNINTMAPFYCLAELIAQKRTDDPRWLAWCDEWAEWIMRDLPKTEDGGFQHSEYCTPTRRTWTG